MLFLEYKEFLNSKNIYLFDSEYRISYQRFINTRELLSEIKLGGSYENINVCKNPFYLIRRKNEKEIKQIINNLMNNKYKLVLKNFNF